MSIYSRFHGPNAGYVLELYERYLEDPNSVDPTTRSYFEQWRPELPSANGTTAMSGVDVGKIVGVVNLAQSIRKHGHFAARLDPLGNPPVGDRTLDPAAHGLSEADLASMPASVVGGPIAAEVLFGGPEDAARGQKRSG